MNANINNIFSIAFKNKSALGLSYSKNKIAVAWRKLSGSVGYFIC